MGRDPRTIKKHLKGIIEGLRILEYLNHPANPNLLIRDPKTYFNNYEEMIKQYGEFKFIPMEKLKIEF